jgi:pimeloyl-ACP methyl ester carboxylesterase
MNRLATALLALAISNSAACGAPVNKASQAVEGFVAVDGVHLQYLDWGGTGPVLLLVPGMGASPHAFDDIASAFVDRFHVISYARRASGNSDMEGPYDIQTSVKDLLGLMDALGIKKADLAGVSAGGAEITQIAADEPDRVDKIVYLDAGYDTADPGAKAVVTALPAKFFDMPANATASLDAFFAYQKSAVFPSLDDLGRIETDLRQQVVIQPDGSVRFRRPADVTAALYDALWKNNPAPYDRVHCPALAIFAATLYDLGVSDPQRRAVLVDYEQKWWHPFQLLSIDKMRHAMPGLKVAQVNGSHEQFLLVDRAKIVSVMRKFLGVRD